MSRPERAADRPATFREVLASQEFRTIYFASTLSWFGDSMARAAVTALVYRETNSVLLAGATFAISYLPWLGIGPVLAALAERYPARQIMIICDVARMATMALVAVPGMPVSMMLLLLFSTALLNPPFDAARSALLPRILDGDRYVVAISLHSTTAQATLITGYLAGGSLAAYDPRMTLLFNAATFGISAFVIGLGVHNREPALGRDERTHLLRETGAGFRLVFTSPLLRAIAILVFSTMLFTVVPEGLAAAWAAQLSPSPHDRGWIQGVIMMATPLGWVLGGLLIGRLARPSTRHRMIRPFALLAPVALIAAASSPPFYAVALISGACGFASGALLPAANGLFVQALPDAFRARAFGVMQSGVALMQGAAILVTGALADRFPLPLVVGAWGLGGVALMLAVIASWPNAQRVADAVRAAVRDTAAERARKSAQPQEITSPAEVTAIASAGIDHGPTGEPQPARVRVIKT